MKPLTVWRTGRRRVRAGVLTGLLLLGLVSCSSGGDETVVQVWDGSSSSPSPSASGTEIKAESKETYLHPDGQYFGVSTFHAPARATTAAAYRASGRHPRILSYYQGWKQSFSASDAELSYKQGALPLLTWEPRGANLDSDQPQYSLKRITSGYYDSYIIEFARDVKATGRPLALRFAHEMNGDWYPWSEVNSGNSRGDYVKAYRHIHDLFQAVGATDVIWIWSPNALRGAKGVALKPLYPGDRYVDWVGIDGYGFGEKTATEVLQPTLDEVRQFSGKPVLLTETGSSPGSQQPGWTADLFRWLKATPNVIGFVWFQHSVDEGGQYDYRFDINPTTKAAFRHGLDSLHLRSWPVANVVTQ
ncbi:glycosyl hydrolase [Streptomyces sp. NPDC047042]|uniref:glycoside hydrolase family 26 protein n=1 Tax=Streptomyces sp. NPDC047042 TaxID=3154807 RepID=UPI0033D8A54E